MTDQEREWRRQELEDRINRELDEIDRTYRRKRLTLSAVMGAGLVGLVVCLWAAGKVPGWALLPTLVVQFCVPFVGQFFAVPTDFGVRDEWWKR